MDKTSLTGVTAHAARQTNSLFFYMFRESATPFMYKANMHEFDMKMFRE